MDHKITVTVDGETTEGERGMVIVCDAKTPDDKTPTRICFCGLSPDVMREALIAVGKDMTRRAGYEFGRALYDAGLEIGGHALELGNTEMNGQDRAAAFRAAAKEVFGRD